MTLATAAALALLAPAALFAETVTVGSTAAPEARPARLLVAEEGEPAVVSDGELVARFPLDPTQQPLVVEHAEAAALTFRPVAMIARHATGTEITRWQPTATRASWSGNLLVYAGVYTGMDARYTVYRDHIKHDLRLHDAPQLPAGTAWLGTQTRLQLPAGYALRPRTLLGEPVPGVADMLYVVDAHGAVQYTLPQVVARDADGITRLGRWSYEVEANGSVMLLAEVDADWLRDAAYPVDLDPTVFLAFGQSLVAIFPWEFATSLLGGSIPLPSRSFQAIYAASQFGGASGYITEIGWEPNGSTSLGFQRMRVSIGPAQPNSYAAPNTAFAANFLGTPTVVYDGPALLDAFNGSYTRLPLTNFYQYTAGTDLAILVELFDTPAGGGTSYFIAENVAAPGTAWECAFLFNENVTNPNADFGVFWGLSMVMELRGFYIDDATVPTAYIGSAYSHTFTTGGTATGGTWAANGLPGSFSIDPNTGDITAANVNAADGGEHEIEVRLTVGGETHSRMYTLLVTEPPSITTSTLPNAAANVPYSFTLQGEDGEEPYTWAIINGTLPAALMLDANTGEISGTPTVGDVGSHPLEFELTDANGQTATANLTLEIVGPVSIASTTLPDATDGLMYSAMVATVGGSGDFSFIILNGSLPAGLTLDGNTGEISGSVAFGAEANSPYTFTLQVTDNVSSETDSEMMQLVVQQLPEVDTSEFVNVPLRGGQQWGPFDLKTIGGAAPFTFIVLNLPPGVAHDDTADPNTIGGVVDNSVTSNDTFSTRIIAIDANGAVTSATVILRGPVVAAAGSSGCGTLADGPAAAAWNVAALVLFALLLAVVRRRVWA